jgi:hypothetical protein
MFVALFIFVFLLFLLLKVGIFAFTCFCLTLLKQKKREAEIIKNADLGDSETRSKRKPRKKVFLDRKTRQTA